MFCFCSVQHIQMTKEKTDRLEVLSNLSTHTLRFSAICCYRLQLLQEQTRTDYQVIDYNNCQDRRVKHHTLCSLLDSSTSRKLPQSHCLLALQMWHISRNQVTLVKCNFLLILILHTHSTQYYWQHPVLLAVLVGLEVLMMGYTVTAISPNNGHAMLNL